MFGQNDTCVNTADSLLRTIETSFTASRTFEDIAEVQNASEILCSMPGCTEDLRNYVHSCNIQVSISNHD